MTGPCGQDEYISALETEIKDALAAIRGNNDESQADQEWLASHWSRQQNGPMYSDYLAATKSTNSDLDRMFRNIAVFKSVTFKSDGNVEKWLDQSSYKNGWKNLLSGMGLLASQTDAYSFVHRLGSLEQAINPAVEQVFGFAGRPYHSNYSLVLVSQDNAVYFLGDYSSGGRLVRGDVVLFWLSDFNFSLPKDNSVELESLNDETMEHFAEALRSHR